MWLSRFGAAEPAAVIAASDRMADDFASLWDERQGLDAVIEGWAAGLSQGDLDGDLAWWRGRRSGNGEAAGALRGADLQPSDASPRAGACDADGRRRGDGGDRPAVRALTGPLTGRDGVGFAWFPVVFP